MVGVIIKCRISAISRLFFYLFICLVMILVAGCGDAKMHRKIAGMDTETLERISKDYPSESKTGQFIADELSRRPRKLKENHQTRRQASTHLSETRTDQRSISSLAHKLANINERGYVSSDHITVSRFRSLLNQMSDKFNEDEQQISDMSVKALELLEKEGIHERLLNIMEGLNTLPVTARGLPSSWHEYRQYVALYVSARTKLSHEETIKGLRAFIMETLRLTRDQ